MNPAARGQNNTVITVATIAADLHTVMHIAWSVSIAAKNAMIIAAQAGEQARSFQPITRFIDEIARTTIASTQQVERESIRLTRLSAYYLRSKDAYERFERVQRIGAEARYLATFSPVVGACLSRLLEQTQQLLVQLRRLGDYMEELDQNMRAALAVASVCRIEASRAGDYRDNLSVVADDLERAARNIQEMVKDGLDRIRNIQLDNHKLEAIA